MRKNKYMDKFHKLDVMNLKYRARCKCGHSVCNAPGFKKEYIICNWCGSRVYKDPKKQDEYDKRTAKKEFEYELRKSIDELHDREIRKMVENKKRKPRIHSKNFKDNNSYFDFLAKNDINVITLEFNEKGYIRIQFHKKQGRPKKKKDNEYKKRISLNNNRYKYFK